MNDNITIGDIKGWISQCKSIHGLQSIRAKANKRIKSLIVPKEISPFAHIPIKDKREVLKDLLI